MKSWPIIVFVLLLPISVFAEGDTAISRRDGFLYLWSGIHRPHEETSETPYLDVQPGDHGFIEIIYAKRRGLLDDTEAFFPDAPLTVYDAVMWLFRTRNVAELAMMSDEGIERLLRRYPIVSTEGDLKSEFVSQADLERLVQTLTTMLREEEHLVSYYADDFHGKGTAFGETFDMHAITAAHPTFPHNTLVRVTNLENNESVIVRVNDRGPYAGKRSMDLSLAAFETISPRSRGVITATLERLGHKDLIPESPSKPPENQPETDPEPVDTAASSCSRFADRYQQRITRDVRFARGIPHALSLGETLTLQSSQPFVVRSITSPDGERQRIEQWIYQDRERYSFVPDRLGIYEFHVSTGFGRSRTMTMKTINCE